MRRPTLTIGAVLVAVAGAIVQYTVPDAVGALERDGSADWWRPATSVLVQTLGWYQVAANLVTLAVLGALVESRLGRRWWLALFVTGTAAGQLAAYAQGELGGGDSIGICGLAGGLAVLAYRDLLAGTAVAGYVLALTAWAGAGTARAVLAAALLPTPALAIVLAPVLAAFGDLHGVALTAGAAAGLLGLGYRHTFSSSSSTTTDNRSVSD